VSEVRRTLIRPDSPNRFVPLDPQVFLDPAVTSPAYVNRYGDQHRRLAQPFTHISVVSRATTSTRSVWASMTDSRSS
jgi:hypothetical protein